MDLTSLAVLDHLPWCPQLEAEQNFSEGKVYKVQRTSTLTGISF